MLSRFDNMECLLNKPVTWGIITANASKALAVFKEVEDEFAGLLKSYSVYPNYPNNIWVDEFINGVRLIWVHPNEDFCGCRFKRAWVDRDISPGDWARIAPMLTINTDDITYI